MREVGVRCYLTKRTIFEDDYLCCPEKLQECVLRNKVMVESSDKRGLLEKGMPNHLSILALRTP